MLIPFISNVVSFTIGNKINGVSSTTTTTQSSCVAESSFLKGPEVEFEINECKYQVRHVQGKQEAQFSLKLSESVNGVKRKGELPRSHV